MKGFEQRLCFTVYMKAESYFLAYFTVMFWQFFAVKSTAVLFFTEYK